MSEWKECKLGDVMTFGNGKVRPKTQGLFPVYGGNGVLGYCNQFNYEGETIVIGRVGAYCGSVYYENKPIWVSDNALAAKPKGTHNTKFLYYYLKNLGLKVVQKRLCKPLSPVKIKTESEVFLWLKKRNQNYGNSLKSMASRILKMCMSS